MNGFVMSFAGRPCVLLGLGFESLWSFALSASSFEPLTAKGFLTAGVNGGLRVSGFGFRFGRVGRDMWKGVAVLLCANPFKSNIWKLLLLLPEVGGLLFFII